MEVFGGSSGNLLLGNEIGRDNLGNKLQGVLLAGSPSGAKPSGNLVGAGNVVQFSGGNGVAIFSADANLVSGVVIHDSAADGIALASSNGNVVQGVASSKNGGNGVSIVSGMDNRVASSFSTGNHTSGFLIASSTRSVIGGNVVTGNTLHGISLNDTTDTTIGSGNNVADNLADGLNVVAAKRTIVFRSQFTSNGEDGLDLIGATGAVVLGNTISKNRVDGVKVEQGSSGNRIGAPGPASDRNVIVGNLGNGVEVLIGTRQASGSQNPSPMGNTIENNLIGLDASGAPMGNGVGVFLNAVERERRRGQRRLWEYRDRSADRPGFRQFAPGELRRDRPDRRVRGAQRVDRVAGADRRRRARDELEPATRSGATCSRATTAAACNCSGRGRSGTS